MATPPTFIAENETTSGWFGEVDTQSTAAFNSAVGDVWVTGAIVENNNRTIAAPTNTGTAQAFTLRGTAGAADYTEIAAYTAVVANTLTSQTISQGAGITGDWWGFAVLRFSGSAGIGATPAAEQETNNTAPSLTFTTTGDNSAIVVFVGDWNSADGASRVWRTVNSITPTAGNGFETTYARDAARYTVHIGYYPDAGAAGSKTVGLSAPTTMKASIVAVEVRGTAGAAPATQFLLMPARSA